MPELPEAEAIRRGLAPLAGARIEAVTVQDARGISRHDRSRGDFRRLLTGRTIRGCARRGKFLWLPLGRAGQRGVPPQEALLAHMGMSGHISLVPEREPAERALRVSLTLRRAAETAPRRPQDAAGAKVTLRFIDQRTFGSLAVEPLVPAADGRPAGRGTRDALLPRQAAHIARDPLDPWFDEELFLTRLARRRSTLKRALLDQSLISGVGNIYADEALWSAGLHYDEPTHAIARDAARRLLARLRGILARAEEDSGTSFDALYVDVHGRAGRYGTRLAVYGREGLPCPRCGAAVRRARFMNRSSYFCPHCQPRPRPAGAGT